MAVEVSNGSRVVIAVAGAGLKGDPGQDAEMPASYVEDITLDSGRYKVAFSDGTTLYMNRASASEDASGNYTLTVVGADGTSHSVTIPAASDSNNTGGSVSGLSFANGKLTLTQTVGDDVAAGLPLNWETAASGTLAPSDFVDGFPTTGSEGITAHVLGVREGSMDAAQNGTFWINTGIEAPMRYGLSGFYRAKVKVSGPVTDSNTSTHGCWFFETDVIPITYWWGKHFYWIRFRPIIKNVRNLKIESVDWTLYKWLEGKEST